MGGSPSFPVVSLPRDRIVVVTGGNTGIGYEAAKNIALMGATVIIACRSEERATEAIRRMNAEYQRLKANGKLKDEHTHGDTLNVEFLKLDLASLKSTMDFIEAFKASGRPLHLLLCNAGIAMVPRGFTEDGYELQFQVNYLGHFLIVAHLLPIMKTSGEDCRIVFTSSVAHEQGIFNMAKSQAPTESGYIRLQYYGLSKLYQIQHMHSLCRRLGSSSNVTVTAMHPGVVSTEITRNYTDLKCLSCLVDCIICMRMVRTPYQGAVTLIDAATNPKKCGITGEYFVDCKSTGTSYSARNKAYQEELWDYSLNCLNKYLPDNIVSALEGPPTARD